MPFAAAGGTDIAARRLGESLSQTLGQTIVIENRPGANCIIAGQALPKADPDGYTLLVATAASFAAAPALGQKLPYDVGKGFAPVGMLGLFPLVLNVAPGLPVATLAEFIAYAKARPDQLNFASAGVGGTNHLVFEMILRASGITLAHVPYRGAELAQADVMSGQVQVMVDSLAASLGNIQGDKLKALAVTTADRQPQLASVPTLKERGVDLVYPGWASIVAHAATPPGVLALAHRSDQHRDAKRRSGEPLSGTGHPAGHRERCRDDPLHGSRPQRADRTVTGDRDQARTVARREGAGPFLSPKTRTAAKAAVGNNRRR